jgi:hypothetical protein
MKLFHFSCSYPQIVTDSRASWRQPFSMSLAPRQRDIVAGVGGPVQSATRRIAQFIPQRNKSRYFSMNCDAFANRLGVLGTLPRRREPPTESPQGLSLAGRASPDHLPSKEPPNTASTKV